MKKIISLVIVLSICMSLINVAFATDKFDGDLDLSEGAEVYVQTKEDAMILMEKLANMPSPRVYEEGTYNAINVPVFEQETSYYCAPATVKQVLGFVNGSSESQSYYASSLGTTQSGTDMTVIDDVLRDESSKYYVYHEIDDYGDWITKVISGIDNGMPAVLGIKTINISAWPYHVEGHFVNTSGYDFRSGSKVRITDPWTQGLGNIWYNASDVYNANMDHWRQAMVW